MESQPKSKEKSPIRPVKVLTLDLPRISDNGTTTLLTDGTTEYIGHLFMKFFKSYGEENSEMIENVFIFWENLKANWIFKYFNREKTELIIKTLL